jgi:rubrerythrin
MAKLGRALRRGVEAFEEARESRRYQAAGKQVVCQHCGNDTFTPEEAMLNRTGRTFFDLDWTDKAGTALVCNRCGLIHWFLEPPEPLA